MSCRHTVGMISGFHLKVAENCALPGYYRA